MKKVLVISEDDDLSTDDVISWLYNLGALVYRISDSNPVQLEQCLLSNNIRPIQSIKAGDIVINLIELEGIWYRRGQLLLKTLYEKPFLFSRFREIEDNKLMDFFDNNNNNNVLQINQYRDNYINKLHVLREAIKLDINVPDTYIVCKKSDIPSEKSNNYVTKAIAEMGRTFRYKGRLVYHSCNVQLLSEIEDIPENFAPSLIQKYIDKKLEIRSFYLLGEFKSMAIFSQQNPKTKIDFRNYDNIKPNRCVPFSLPKNIEHKLDILMQNLNLNSGSIDLILTPSNDYYFLEVNPIGQFQWLSKNCNYHIEKLIANQLISYK